METDSEGVVEVGAVEEIEVLSYIYHYVYILKLLLTTSWLPNM